MCDCFTAKCRNTRCKETLEVHVADFCLPRDAFDVYCRLHLPAPGPLTIVYRANVAAWDRCDHEDWQECMPAALDPADWAMAVVYHQPPPDKYGLRAVSPNEPWLTTPKGAG